MRMCAGTCDGKHADAVVMCLAKRIDWICMLVSLEFDAGAPWSRGWGSQPLIVNITAGESSVTCIWMTGSVCLMLCRIVCVKVKEA